MAAVAIVDYASYVYGGLLITGGLIGAAKGSTVSLIAGGGVGASIIALQALGGGAQLARGVQTVLSSVVLYNMAQRFRASGKFMPAGMVSALSAAYVLLNAATLLGVLPGGTAVKASARKA